MKEQEIIAGNRLIAEFMGGKRVLENDGYQFDTPPISTVRGTVYHTDDLVYHSDWRLLMPVVEKIGLMRGWNVNLGFGDPVIFDDDYKQTGRGKRFAVCEPTKDWRQCTWETVVVFLKYQKTGVLQSNNEEGKQ